MQENSIGVLMCDHSKGLDMNIRAKTPEGCEECLKEGSKWVDLRICLSCGHVGCGDVSPSRHATRHFQKSDHSVVEDYPDRKWKWCYIDNEYVK